MKLLDHPFVLGLKGIAQDKRFIFMFMDYVPTGDLMGVIEHFDGLNPD